MTRIHDMGGRFGDGPVLPDPAAYQGDAEPPFAAPWHARACAVTLAAGALGGWSIDTSRHAREKLAPKDYARFSYYEKWLAALADLLVEAGFVTEAELAAGDAAPAPLHPKALKAERVAAVLAAGTPYLREEAPAPRLAPGDRVRTRLVPARNAARPSVPGGHTRLPGYAAGRVGTVLACRGAHVFPDMNAHRRGEAPEPLYTIAFAAADLWGEAEGAGDEVLLDLWDSYLEPA